MSCDCNNTCSNTIYQSANVNIPISMIPGAVVGDIKTKCCGNPTISIQQDDCCRCVITVSQVVTYEIPIEYGVESQVGSATSHFRKIGSCKD